ncbi:hypothetical protein CDCA_CDCA02G0635 [Cyanidium caldarium]|uniref:AB hydrolase-1 domain-containing protein n=1 Tax=Cyanidium caldarium TaxID=2771 RepID=A0AAV9IR99_CYACA|nr:hypothetical protein CDCA_CDCA02G0635 [Cyanidium caldarium]
MEARTGESGMGGGERSEERIVDRRSIEQAAAKRAALLGRSQASAALGEMSALHGSPPDELLDAGYERDAERTLDSQEEDEDEEDEEDEESADQVGELAAPASHPEQPVETPSMDVRDMRSLSDVGDTGISAAWRRAAGLRREWSSTAILSSLRRRMRGEAAASGARNRLVGPRPLARSRSDKPSASVPRSPSLLLQNLNRGRKMLARKSVEAASEAAEFITSPTLLFRPTKMVAALLLPMLMPLLVLPWRALLFLTVFFAVWYLAVAAVFASEVAMRPPWYRPGRDGKLSMVEIPGYWRGVCHDPQHDLGLAYEDVSFLSLRPGLTQLRGWYVPAESVPEAAPKICVIAVHGAGRDRRAFLRHSEVLHRHHYDVLLFDVSEHGLSDGHGRGSAFGVREKYDVLGAVAYVRQQRHVDRVVLLGTSAGASSCILAAAEVRVRRDRYADLWGEPPHPAPIDCVIAENPLATPDELFRFHLERLSLNYLPRDTYHLARRAIFWFASQILLFRLTWDDMAPLGNASSWRSALTAIGAVFQTAFLRRRSGAADVVADIDCPLLVLHGTGDEIVPVDHGMRVFAAAREPRYLWLAEDAAHCALFDQHPDEWERRVVEFVERSLSDSSEK